MWKYEMSLEGRKRGTGVVVTIVNFKAYHQVATGRVRKVKKIIGPEKG